MREREGREARDVKLMLEHKSYMCDVLDLFAYPTYMYTYKITGKIHAQYNEVNQTG